MFIIEYTKQDCVRSIYYQFFFNVHNSSMLALIIIVKTVLSLILSLHSWNSLYCYYTTHVLTVIFFIGLLNLETLHIFLGKRKQKNDKIKYIVNP